MQHAPHTRRPGHAPRTQPGHVLGKQEDASLLKDTVATGACLLVCAVPGAGLSVRVPLAAPSQQGNDKTWVTQVRQQFKANLNEVDDEKIKEQREA
eukprot:364360-Chlamydomonas_euryale.AAC.4